MQKLGLELPLNSTSLGQTSVAFLRCLYEKEKAGNLDIDLYLFLIGGIDLSAQQDNPDFNKWIQSKAAKALESWDRNIPLFKLWHLESSLQSFSNKQTLLTFFETDSPTKYELNIARNNKLCLSSKFSQEVFKIYGVSSHYVPLFFEKFNFKAEDKKFHTDSRIVFNLAGKLEKRKCHAKVIQAWVKRFGNNRDYVLQCALYNPFLQQQTPQGIVDYNQKFISDIVGSSKPYNLIFYPWLKELALYNQWLNSGNIVIDMSGAESFSLPSFHSLCLGKHGVILNATAMKDWADDANAVLVNPSGKEEIYDNIFFKQGNNTNQGNMFSWNEDDFIAGCEKAIERYKTNPVNTEGLKLQEQFTCDRFTDKVLEIALSS